MTYLFFLGRKHELCFAELEAVLLRNGIEVVQTITPYVALAHCGEVSAQSLMGQLGGTVKIAALLQEFPLKNLDELRTQALELIAAELKKAQKKVTFSINAPQRFAYGQDEMGEVKKSLSDEGISSRYLASPQDGLSAAQLLHHEIEECILVENKETAVVYLAKTSAVQNIDFWSLRDFSKPYRDPRKGMLPPKLALMLVNLGLGGTKPENARLLDPFCGTGTVLMEAALLGATAYGSDLMNEAVQGSIKNLEWLSTKRSLPGSFRVFQQDATHVSIKDLGEPVDCIVTEPFMGKPNPTYRESAGIVKGLKKLYLGCFKQWRELLIPNGKVVITLPEFHFGKTVKNMDYLLDKMSGLGYTREKGPMIYDRPQTIVKRAVYIFTKK